MREVRIAKDLLQQVGRSSAAILVAMMALLTLSMVILVDTTALQEVSSDVATYFFMSFRLTGGIACVVEPGGQQQCRLVFLRKVPAGWLSGLQPPPLLLYGPDYDKRMQDPLCL